jgi:hypothetical protein
VNLTEQIRGEVGAGPQVQGYLNLILNKYSAEDLARAYPELGFDAEDYRVAKEGLPKDLIVPGSLDAEGRQQFVQGTTEFIRAEQIATQAARDAVRRAAIANGLGGPNGDDVIAITGNVNGKIYLTVNKDGRSEQIDISEYLEGLPKQPVPIGIGVAAYGTNTVATPFRNVTVTALPEVARTVNTSEGAIVVDANSETARLIQWKGSQPGIDGRPLRETWARQGISDPYSNPAIVEQALEQIDRADARTALFNQSGVTPPGSTIAPWNDPNWPAYQGSNKEAYALASAALTDTNVKNQLKAENGWDEATFQSWALRSTNPEEAARLARISDAAAGLVVGPGPSGTTGLSANGATVVAVTGNVNSQGFATFTVTGVNATAGPVNGFLLSGGVLAPATGVVTGAANTALANLPVPVLPDIAGIATGFAEGFTDSLPDLPSITGALQLTAAQVAGLAQAAQDTAAGLIEDIRRLPAAIPDSLSPYVTAAVGDITAAAGLSAINDLLIQQNATIQKAKEQATIQARNNEAAGSIDWRVRLQLAPGAQYLYKDREPGILGPLKATDGVIFPYTPSIETSYVANYDKYDLTHSNYRGYFYKNSAVNDINIRGTFTAQDTAEADYVLAVIHFFRSVTKMFYGAQDKFRGAPPPLVYLSGYGDYQFNDHPCLVSNFSYSLPTDVDYIRAGAPNNYGNLFSQRDKRGAISTNPISAVIQRLSNSNLPTSPVGPPAPSPISQNVNNLTGATYVPTKIEINITLLPTNTRSQVSQQFSVKEFANGNLLKGGFW